ncbi:hypothetical protein PTSG_11341 [Salpingoeca rosetta]|uniref:Uncharacterized protein n=1 Tax=Salpingoeca rosetta (strain ATCC 50818 / BSB-021) TaxID=946362 RepID=F2UT45_SALR5|nr:uncharacterized protein PTSG_11341 [Salpingoeca rosetta]EGD81304.1 hypothetical protein PTSG_11341 [Salpingoeca rosetta]|eukprot:XP_004987700.1 hypothetical protein PTSG_11341 [Salpingoeca rosetta]
MKKRNKNAAKPPAATMTTTPPAPSLRFTPTMARVLGIIASCLLLAAGSTAQSLRDFEIAHAGSTDSPAPSCQTRYAPRVYAADPPCGFQDRDGTVRLSTGIDPAVQGDARATCAFWLPFTVAHNTTTPGPNGTTIITTTSSLKWSCSWHGCEASATVVDGGNAIVCAVPGNMPTNITATGPDGSQAVRVTVRVWHAQYAGGSGDSACQSHGGEPPALWDQHDYVVAHRSCGCPPGVGYVECEEPDMCRTHRCLAHPRAVCEVSHCGVCAVRFYAEKRSSYEGVAPLDCLPRDKCTGECRKEFEACSQYTGCREALYRLVDERASSGTCNGTCHERLAVPTEPGRTLFDRVWSCYRTCEERETVHTVCALPPRAGQCKGRMTRWYFDRITGKCRQFAYGGCGGNGNNFETREACEQRCELGACCTRRTVLDDVGYDANGYDQFGYDRRGYARDGFSRRPWTYAEFVRNTFDLFGLDERGYDPRGLDGSGFSVDGMSQNMSRDGLQFEYLEEQMYDAWGVDRANMSRQGFDLRGYGYNGLYRQAEYTCQQTTREQCQALEEGDPNTDVVSFVRGVACGDRQCGNPQWQEPRQCIYQGRRYNYGETFRYACQWCVCGTDGAVTCQCTPRRRREIRDLTLDEVQTYIDAIWRLYNSGNRWNEFVNMHLGAATTAHGNPTFLPWHREFTNQFELALREVTGNCDFTLPYWDWTIDSSSPETSPVWNLIGGNGQGGNNCVQDGPFAGFRPCLRRNWDSSVSIPSIADVTNVLRIRDYTTMSARLEAIHGNAHNFIGSQMSTMSAPYDPVFFLHHAYVDKQWYDWQVVLGNGNDFTPERLHDTMDPFPKTPADVLDSEGQLCVVYEPPGRTPPCNEALFGGSYETKGYYAPGARPQYDRDGYDRDGYDRRGLDKLGRNRDGVRVGGVTATGFNTAGVDSRGCSIMHPMPLYMRDVFQAQRELYRRIQANAYVQPARTCSPLQPLPAWWKASMWMSRGGLYGAIMDAYEAYLEEALVRQPDEWQRDRTQSQPSILEDLCFAADDLTLRQDDSWRPGDDYQCPPGLPRQNCEWNPCANATCPGSPDATCWVNPCGRCRPEFYREDGSRARCYSTCPVEEGTCTFDPCAYATCEANPEAVCETSPCGGCEVEWSDPETGEPVTCDVEPDSCAAQGQTYVCGEDGQTYDNVCYAREAGVKIAYGGLCVACERLCPPEGMAAKACGEDWQTYASVNFFKASDAGRQQLCNEHTSCLTTVARSADNRCFWNEDTRRCSCQPSDVVCTAGAHECARCCNDDLRRCLRWGQDSVDTCWREAYVACTVQCAEEYDAAKLPVAAASVGSVDDGDGGDGGDGGINIFLGDDDMVHSGNDTNSTAPGPTGPLDTVVFRVGLRGRPSTTMDAAQFAEATSLAVGRASFVPSAMRVVGASAMAAERLGNTTAGVELEVNAESSDGYAVQAALEAAVVEGRLAKEVAIYTGSATTDDVMLVGAVEVIEPPTTPAPTDDPKVNPRESDAAIPIPAIAGVVAALIVIVGCILAVAIVRKRSCVRPKASESTSPAGPRGVTTVGDN